MLFWLGVAMSLGDLGIVVFDIDGLIVVVDVVFTVVCLFWLFKGLLDLFGLGKVYLKSFYSYPKYLDFTFASYLLI